MDFRAPCFISFSRQRTGLLARYQNSLALTRGGTAATGTPSLVDVNDVAWRASFVRRWCNTACAGGLLSVCESCWRRKIVRAIYVCIIWQLTCAMSRLRTGTGNAGPGVGACHECTRVRAAQMQSALGCVTRKLRCLSSSRAPLVLVVNSAQ